MKKLIPLAVMALVAGCSSTPKDVYLSCMPDKVEITTIGGVDPGKKQGDPKEYDFLLRFNIDEQTANKGSDKYKIDESEDELRSAAGAGHSKRTRPKWNPNAFEIAVPR